MERKLIANYLVPDDEVWVSPATWERPFSQKAKESTVTDTQQLKAEIAALEQAMPLTVSKCSSEIYKSILRRLRQLSAV